MNSIKTYITKTQNLFVYIIFLIIDFLLGLKKPKLNPSGLLIIRLDSIGDYILFRNFLKILKESTKYGQCNLTLCGNIVWKDLAETFDGGFVDNFIWINRKKFYKNPFYKYRVLKNIRDEGFNTVIETVYTREILYGDSIVKVSKAKERIGCSGSLDKHAKWKRNFLSDKYYTRLIPLTEENLFEFYRNKEFFEKLLDSEIDIKRPELNVSNIHLNRTLPEKYFVVFHGARDLKRRWSLDNFARVAKYIIGKYNLQAVIPCSEKDFETAEYIKLKAGNEQIHNFCRNTSLSQLAKIIEGAELLLSNETGAVHIAAAVNTNFVCVSNGNHLGRFHPYPKEIFGKAYYIYPEEIYKALKGDAMLMEKLRFNSEININKVLPEEVIKQIDVLIKPEGKIPDD